MKNVWMTALTIAASIAITASMTTPAFAKSNAATAPVASVSTAAAAQTTCDHSKQTDVWSKISQGEPAYTVAQSGPGCGTFGTSCISWSDCCSQRCTGGSCQ